ncbi:hypothetical protein Pyn_34815 [Prunus yedoensis var. nudiflora]|uniref:Uncharacterized protein n=1 Tax=Prunus yedoensis var. nudiflora TaxID=2094558 RepID=A0A314Y999_PRUYE|nr:hypothetical protein Pyn_34815 [Prunus yedoensis var. nudiflora]
MARPSTPSLVVIAYDATKDHSLHELRLTVNGVRKGGDILSRGDTIIFLGVLDKVLHPLGYQAKPCLDSIGTSIRAVKEAVREKVDGYVNMLLRSAQQCEDQRVSIKVKVIAGFPVKQVILQELMACNAAWVVLDRHLKRYLEFYLMHIPCKIAVIEDSLTVEVVRAHQIEDTDTVDTNGFMPCPSLFRYSTAKGALHILLHWKAPICLKPTRGKLEPQRIKGRNKRKS